MLRRIVAKYGKEIGGAAGRCKGLLNDLCGSYRREINILVIAIEERIPLDLLAGAGSLPLELLLSRLEKRLEDERGLTAEAARWATESWALALVVATDAQIEERARRQSALPAAKIEKIQPAELPENAGDPGVSDLDEARPGALPKTKTSFPPPKGASPAGRQPIKLPPAFPPGHLPASNRPPVQASRFDSPPASNSAALPKFRFRLFRGCLIVFFLLIASTLVLLFGVPYAIEMMRETQRQKNDAPRRFPTR